MVLEALPPRNVLCPNGTEVQKLAESYRRHAKENYSEALLKCAENLTRASIQQRAKKRTAEPQSKSSIDDLVAKYLNKHLSWEDLEKKLNKIADRDPKKLLACLEKYAPLLCEEETNPYMKASNCFADVPNASGIANAFASPGSRDFHGVLELLEEVPHQLLSYETFPTPFVAKDFNETTTSRKAIEKLELCKAEERNATMLEVRYWLLVLKEAYQVRNPDGSIYGNFWKEVLENNDQLTDAFAHLLKHDPENPQIDLYAELLREHPRGKVNFEAFFYFVKNQVLQMLKLASQRDLSAELRSRCDGSDVIEGPLQDLSTVTACLQDILPWLPTAQSKMHLLVGDYQAAICNILNTAAEYSMSMLDNEGGVSQEQAIKAFEIAGDVAQNAVYLNPLITTTSSNDLEVVNTLHEKIISDDAIDENLKKANQYKFWSAYAGFTESTSLKTFSDFHEKYWVIIAYIFLRSHSPERAFEHFKHFDMESTQQINPVLYSQDVQPEEGSFTPRNNQQGLSSKRIHSHNQLNSKKQSLEYPLHVALLKKLGEIAKIPADVTNRHIQSLGQHTHSMRGFGSMRMPGAASSSSGK